MILNAQTVAKERYIKLDKKLNTGNKNFNVFNETIKMTYEVNYNVYKFGIAKIILYLKPL